jgi:uncharacterized damage-inducible protein DinB
MLTRAAALFLFAASLAPVSLRAQKPDPLEGLWQGFDGEWGHVSRQVIALAEAFPQEKYSWRPAPGVRSVSEVFMHIAIANFGLLSRTGPPVPSDLTSEEQERTVTKKEEVVSWLKRSFEAVRAAHAAAKPADLQRRLKIMERDVNADGIYLRIIVHANEHMGQLIAYARTSGVVPPWAEK